MSNDVMWQVLRHHHSHLVKRDGIVLSGEPGNLLNRHSYKFSGLANNNIVHVAADSKDVKKIALTVNKGKGRLQRHPATSRVVIPLSRHRRARAIRAAHVINNATERAFHRRDLTKLAIARYHALYRASKVKEGQGVNVKRRRAGAKAKKAAGPSTA